MDYWLAGQKHDSYCRVHAPFRFEVAENPQPDAPGTILVAGVPCIRNRADQLYVGDVLVDTDTRVNADGSLREVARRRTVLYVGPAHHDEHKVTLVIKSEFNTDAGEWLKDHPFVVEIRTP